ncbi:MAG: AMP-binding protein, partial [bacterium]|nr:AMP-binding protein [bacterium]
KETVHRFARYFNNILAFVVDNPRTAIGAVEIMSAEEKEQVLYDFNRNTTKYTAHESLHEIFSEEAQRNPRNIAVVVPWGQPHQSVTYETLNREAGRLARKLAEKGIRPGSIIAVLMERSLEMIMATLAVLKAGCAYMPIDPAFPQERIEYMCRDSHTKLLLTAFTPPDASSPDPAPITQKLPANPAFPIYDISDFHGSNHPGDGEESARHGGDLHRTLPKNRGADLAYIIYTSGSTGTPKGTLISHRNVARVVKNTNYIDIRPGDRLLQLSNYAFDGSVFDIYGALLNSAALVLVNKQDVASPERLSRLIKKEKITMFFVTSSLFNVLADGYLDHFESVRKVLVGGERLSVKHIRKALEILGPGRIINGYGPTETTVFA